MKNFMFSNETRILFGSGAEASIGSEVTRFATRVLVVCSRGASNRTGIVDRVEGILRENGVVYFELTGIKPNPEMSKVYEGIELVKEQKLELVLAIGGGSMIDTAKGIATGALYEGDVWELYKQRKVERALPIGVVLTFPAAGSESSLASVVTNEKTQEKLDILGLCIRPRFAVLNPDLTFTLPDFQTFCGITDMLSHVMERYFGNDMDNDLTDRLCEATMKSIIHNALILRNEDTANASARAQLMWASTIAHNGILETGREMDWASHGMGMEISAIFDTTHGATLSVITPEWAKYVYKSNVSRFAQFAERVFNVEMDLLNPDRTAREGIRRLEEFFEHIGVPTSMSGIGIHSDERFEEMARKVTRNGPIGGIRKLNADDVVKIYRQALEK